MAYHITMLIPNYWQQFMCETHKHAMVRWAIFCMAIWKGEPISVAPDAVWLISALEESLVLTYTLVHKLILMWAIKLSESINRMCKHLPEKAYNLHKICTKTKWHTLVSTAHVIKRALFKFPCEGFDFLQCHRASTFGRSHTHPHTVTSSIIFCWPQPSPVQGRGGCLTNKWRAAIKYGLKTVKAPCFIFTHLSLSTLYHVTTTNVNEFYWDCM